MSLFGKYNVSTGDVSGAKWWASGMTIAQVESELSAASNGLSLLTKDGNRYAVYKSVGEFPPASGNLGYIPDIAGIDDNLYWANVSKEDSTLWTNLRTKAVDSTGGTTVSSAVKISDNQSKTVYSKVYNGGAVYTIDSTELSNIRVSVQY